MEVLALQDAHKFFTPRYIIANLAQKSSQKLISNISKILLRIVPDLLLDLVLPPFPEGILLIAKNKLHPRDPVVKYFRVESNIH